MHAIIRASCAKAISIILCNMKASDDCPIVMNYVRTCFIQKIKFLITTCYVGWFLLLHF
jgi:hypothetical protein